MRITDRIAILEAELGKSGNSLGVQAGLGNGTVQGWTDNQLEKPTAAVEKFLRYYSINPEWWRTGKGDIFVEKHTSVQKRSDNTGKKAGEGGLDEVLDIVEASKDYFVIPRSVLRENYRLVALEHFEAEKKKLEHEREQYKEQAAINRMNLDAHIEANKRLLAFIDKLTAQLEQMQVAKK